MLKLLTIMLFLCPGIVNSQPAFIPIYLPLNSLQTPFFLEIEEEIPEEFASEAKIAMLLKRSAWLRQNSFLVRSRDPKRWEVTGQKPVEIQEQRAKSYGIDADGLVSFLIEATSNVVKQSLVLSHLEFGLGMTIPDSFHVDGTGRDFTLVWPVGDTATGVDYRLSKKPSFIINLNAPTVHNGSIEHGHGRGGRIRAWFDIYR